MKIPEQYSPIMPYINVSGAVAFTTFMEEVFHAKVQYAARSGETIQHGELRIGEAVIMYMEANTLYPPFPSASFIWVENVDAVLQRAVSLGGTVLNEIADRDYGRGGGFADPFGNVWWVNSPIG
ncbi:VOC family protein [Pseudochryseolinea flava]|uniref:VOC family protein n=1 Tax=Pseudochryseolinea flava TaxID=2059302 RepID=A0A364YD17_9BACT|nr:VOC family protein [Pseudochryseolinea flava]RAW03528.1 VOC family protein [Pseudochryseolinea flava]